MNSPADGSNVVLRAVGDIMLGDHPVCMGHGVGSTIEKKGDPVFPFREVVGELSQADIVHGNLEVVLSERGLDRNSLRSRQMRGKPTSIAGLEHAGFNILNLANNHILEHGKETLEETIELLDGSNIGYAGVGDYRDRPREIEVKGMRFGLLGACLVDDPGSYRSYGTTDDIVSMVDSVHEDFDVLAVSLHWGSEYVNYPSQQQRKDARRIIDAGAKVLIGHHPHVLQGIERYGGGLIAYSLGNFVFDMWQPKMRESCILEVTFSPEGEIERHRTVPVRINRMHQPVPLSGAEGKNLQDRMERYSGLLDERSGINDEQKMNYGQNMDDYLKEVEEARRGYRRDLRTHILLNLFRYDFMTLKAFFGIGRK